MGSCSSTDNVVTKKAMTPSDLHKKELRRRREALKNSSQEEIAAYYEDYYRHDELLTKSSNLDTEPLDDFNLADTNCFCQYCESVRQARLSSHGGSPFASQPQPEVHWDDSILRKASPEVIQVSSNGSTGTTSGTPLAPALSPANDDPDSSLGNIDTPLLLTGAAALEFCRSDASGEFSTSCRRKQWAAVRANTSAKLTRKRPPPLAQI